MLMSEILMIIAIVVSPIIAIQVENYRERICADKQRRLEIFRTLMATRANTINPWHVEALNMIDIDFSDFKDVTIAWKNYLNHLGKKPEHPSGDMKTNQEAILYYNHKFNSWAERSPILLTILLKVMGESLNYYFDETDINNSCYYPEGSATKENELKFLREQLVELVQGDIALPVMIFKKPLTDQDSHNQEINKNT
jgi:hypothetical protein